MRNTIVKGLLLLALVSFSLGCTIAVIGGEHTVDGRPILWKNRDVPNQHQEFIYHEGGGYPYVATIYEDDTANAWQGTNSEGFAIVNTDVYNLGRNIPAAPSDGMLMKRALMRCVTVDDFQYLLDSTNIDGRRSAHDYGVIDVYGGAAVFEASNYYYTRYDAADSPDGFLVRTNFAMSGDPAHRRGYDRYSLARFLIGSHETVSYRFIMDSVCTYLATDELNPYPLPFEDSFGGLPYGYISTYNTINRFYTTTVAVIQGRASPSDTLLYPVMWGYFGQPIIALPLPLWVRSRSTPPEMDSPSGSVICDKAIELKNAIYDLPVHHLLNTLVAAEIIDFFRAPKEDIYSTVDELVNRWSKESVSPAELESLQNEIASYAYNWYNLGTGLFVDDDEDLPDAFSLEAYPNPFNGVLTVSFALPSTGVAVVSVVDIAGRAVATLASYSALSAGEHTLHWDVPRSISSGVYIIVLRTPGGELSREAVYLK